MVRATPMQERRGRARTVVAALAALVLVVGGLIGLRHEAEVAHVRETSGAMVHGQALADRHEASTAAHLHGRHHAEHADVGSCSLLAISNAIPLIPNGPVAAPHLAVVVEADAVPLSCSHVSVASYRLAPKTSPPSTSV